MSAPATAAVLYTNGKVVTLDPSQPHATALATSGDRIVAVGDEPACRAALRRAGASDVDQVDLQGRGGRTVYDAEKGPI